MIQFVFWLNIFIIFFIYAGYPAVLTVLKAVLKKEHFFDERFTPKVSLLIPAYNEEKVIAQKIENSLRLDYPADRLEIFVIIDESSDKTEEIVKNYLNKGIKMRVQRPRQGKMSALNNAVSTAQIALDKVYSSLLSEDIAMNLYFDNASLKMPLLF